MPEENPVYFGLGYSKSIESKKELLSIEISLLNIIKAIRRYNLLRQEEFKIKTRTYREIKELSSKIRKTQSSFPFLKLPKSIQKTELKKEIKEKSIPHEEIDINLESQLRDIQEKLKSIGQ